ncbi:phosphoglucosamine mutase [Halovenus sp. WSH3]|uniref:Phosphoglucosamine mutase n=1 Tax=Halovenus carboxidivorans TaxID=2692199 RepID=A0A6B0T4Q7_9EURY|nr:phosphoglucosamine mutase [Halovenus carboxidivorans]MXR53115.1 phosphoglucosamine mutase [Halovenus carboxidivorans]
MFGTSGIRGPVGEEVTAALALRVGRALGVDADRVVVGRDPRESGETLQAALAAGLRESGTDVVDLGVAATPTVGRGVAWEDADAGVAITASHNPPEDNGIKLWQPSGQAFDAELREEMTRRIETEAVALADWDEFGEHSSVDHTESHREALIDAVDVERELSVVVDVGNGAGGVTARALEELGCHVETLNAQPDGAFPGRPSEPTAEHCQSLAELVGSTDADVGIAHDGDADRMRAVTAEGEFLTGDVLLALFGREAAVAGEAVALPVDTSLAVEDHLAEADIETRRTPVGDVYVAEAASEEGVAFGGEPSGAWIWPGETLCPDGPLAACKIVAMAATTPLAERADTVETYPIRREAFETDRKMALMEEVSDEVVDRYETVSTLDGVRVDLDDGWFLLRASGTQPLVRMTAEARTEQRAEEIAETAMTLLDEAA